MKTMSCRELQHFIDVAPSRLRRDKELRRAREHADECADCAAYWARAEALEQALESLPESTPPERLVADVMARVQADSDDLAEVAATVASDVAAVTRREKLGWGAAIAGNLAMLAVFLYNLDGATWARSLVSPTLGFRPGDFSWIGQPAAGLLVLALAVLLAAAGILTLPGERPQRPAS